MITEDLHALEANDVPYCVLRNWEFLHGAPIGDDVDVLIPSADRRAAERVLFDRGYKPARGGSSRHSFYKRYLPETDTIVTIDVAWDGPGYNGIPLLAAERTIARRRREAGVWVPADEDLFVELVFHTVLNKDGFASRESYRRTLSELRGEVDRDRVRAHAAAVFGSLGRRVVDLALRGEFLAAERYKWPLVLVAVRRRPAMLSMLFWNLIVFHQLLQPLSRLIRRYNPLTQQPTIVLLGPDGSGKTTTAGHVEQFFADHGVSTEAARLGVYNDSSFVMDALKRVRNAVVGYDADRTERERDAGTMSLGPTNGPAKAVVHAADICIRLLEAHASGADVLVADRYLHDVHIFDDAGVLDPFLGWIAAGPVYVYVLDADPEIISERSEYTVESIRRMRRRLDSVPGTRIDVLGSPERTRADLIEHLLVETDFLSTLR